MKKVLIIIALAVFALSACKKAEKSTTLGTAKEGQFIVGFDDSFPPMGFKEGGQYVGFDLDLAKEVAKRLGLELALQPIVWDVKEQELFTKKIDAIWNGFTITPARLEMLTFTLPYMKNKQVIVVMNDSPIQTLDDLKGKRLSLQRGSSAAEALNKHTELRASVQVLEFEDNVVAMTDLATGNSDAVLMDIIVANYNYLSKSPDRYRILDDALADEEFGVGFRKSDTLLRDKVWQALLDMDADGTVAQISEKWFGSDITTIK